MGKSVKYIPLYLVILTVVMIGVKLVYTKILAKPLETAKPVPVNIAVQDLKPQVYDEVLDLPGRLMAERSVMLASELSGRIEEWKVAEGNSVAKGQVLLVLNSDALEAKLAELLAQEQRLKATKKLAETSVQMAELNFKSAQDAVGTAENRLEIAESDEALAADELKRTTALFNKKIASQIEFDRQQADYTRKRLELSTARKTLSQARNALKLREVEREQSKVGVAQANAGLKEIEAGLGSLKVALEKGQIRAPFAGVIDEHIKEVGDVVQPGEALTWLYDYSSIRIRVNVSDRYAPFLENGETVLTTYLKANFPGAVQNLKSSLIVPGLPTLNGGRSEGVELSAEIAYVGRAGSKTSNTFPVELKAINPGGILKQGLLGRARITILTYNEALMIPLTSMRVTENGPQCFVAVREGEDYIARARSVEPRSIKDSQVMVRGELKPGDKLILTGIQELLDGQSVAIIDTRNALTESESTGD